MHHVLWVLYVTQSVPSFPPFSYHRWVERKEEWSRSWRNETVTGVTGDERFESVKGEWCHRIHRAGRNRLGRRRSLSKRVT
jgi:hypothetical protein